MLQKLALCLAMSLSLPLSGFAQEETPKDAREAISALEFLVGNWAGPGTSYRADGTQTHYHDTEYVRFDLDQKVLLINAAGQDDDGNTIYALHTIIYYDVDAGHYVYTPYSGRTPRSFHCQLEDSPKLLCLNGAEDYRLTFQRLPDGQWNEFGEGLGEDGTWTKFFETILSAAAPRAE